MPVLAKGAARVGFKRASARAQAATTAASAEDVLCIGQDMGENCTVFLMHSAQVAGMYTW